MSRCALRDQPRRSGSCQDFTDQRIGARLGRRERKGSPDYTAYNVGVTLDIIPQLAADVRVHDTGSSDLDYVFKRRLVASLRATFRRSFDGLRTGPFDKLRTCPSTGSGDPYVPKFTKVSGRPTILAAPGEVARKFPNDRTM